MYAGHNSVTEIIDVVMISSLGKKGEINQIVKDYGQEQKVFMQFGPIRYRYTAKDKAKEQGIEHFVYPRFTRLVHTDGETLKINDAYQLVRESDIRNNQIILDVEKQIMFSCYRVGKAPKNEI